MTTTTDSSDVRTRIDHFLAETGVATQVTTVVPLTGDASDRKYFRVLLRNAPTQVLAVHPQAIDFERLPFANVARLYAEANPRFFAGTSVESDVAALFPGEIQH